MSDPDIAVVIPTSRRETRLAFAFEALAAQTLPPDRFEVIVVRDPHDGPWAEPPSSLRTRLLERRPGAGTAVARNLGWRATRARLVAFTDDDCRPAPEWLEALVAASRSEDVFVQGRTEPDPDERHLLRGLARSQEITGVSGWYETCNMAYPRALLERLSGFDERFFFGGEDTDLALRAEEAGARAAYVDGARVWHGVHHRHLGDALSLATRWDFLPMLIARHPEQRRALYRRFFWKEAHAKLLLALAGLMLAPRRPAVAAAAALPYLALRLGPPPRSPGEAARRCVSVPRRALVDGAEVLTTLRAAARHRVLVA